MVDDRGDMVPIINSQKIGRFRPNIVPINIRPLAVIYGCYKSQ